MRHLLAIQQLSSTEIRSLIGCGIDVKKYPKKYSTAAKGKIMLMLFQAPSLRTMISFQTAMIQMGGDAIYYAAEHSPWGMGKEAIEDVAKVISRYCNLIEARIFSQEDLAALAVHASIPVINGMTNAEHPCQILGDLMTIAEHKGTLEGLKVAYVGDANNNVTYSLMYGCAKLGIDISIGCPNKKEFFPSENVMGECTTLAKKSGTRIEVMTRPAQAVQDADVVYTDSWMSYRIPKSQKAKRVKALQPYQVNGALMKKAKSDAVFMHCLPALRGQEVTGEVMDGKNSIVFDQAENRLHIQKAIIAELLRQ